MHKRFIATRIVGDDQKYGTEWYVMDCEVWGDPYIGPCRSKIDAEDTASRYNANPMLAPTTPSVDYSGSWN